MRSIQQWKSEAEKERTLTGLYPRGFLFQQPVGASSFSVLLVLILLFMSGLQTGSTRGGALLNLLNGTLMFHEGKGSSSTKIF